MATNGAAQPEASSHSNYAVILPQDAQEVQIIALAVAFEGAWDAYHNKIRAPFLPLLIRGLATSAPEPYLQAVVDGRKATNDEPAFRAIFADVLERGLPAMLALLARDAQARRHLATIPRSSPDFDREMHRIAMANLSVFLATPENEPLVLTWPLLDMQEGGV